MARRLTARERNVKAALDRVRADCDVAARRQADPVGFVHRYDHRLDQELIALVAACIAFGNVKTIRAKLGDLVDRLGIRPSLLARNPLALRQCLRGWKHRVFRGQDIARLLAGAAVVQEQHGSLGALLSRELEAGASLREALCAWCDAIRAHGGLNRVSKRRGPAHLLADPRGSSGCKRLLLFLRWMVRPADGIDLGLWDVDPARLLVPVDVHIHRLARNLGLTRRKDLSWKTTEEITAALARLDPADPAGYDFSLCHMGMLQGCPSRADARACEGCGVRAVCVHWATKGGRGRGSSLAS